MQSEASQRALQRSKQAEQALREAHAEGLTLFKSPSNSSGYLHVYPRRRGNANGRYRIVVNRSSLGVYDTPEQAALAFARSPQGRALAVHAPAGTAFARAAEQRWRQLQEQQHRQEGLLRRACGGPEARSRPHRGRAGTLGTEGGSLVREGGPKIS